MTRKAIRDQVRKIIGQCTDLKRFGPRDHPLSLKELPACIVYFPHERMIEKKDELSERELTLHIESVIQPKKDAELEIFHLSDQIEDGIFDDKALEGLSQDVTLDTVDFFFESEGEIPLAAVRQIFRIRYLTEEKPLPPFTPKEVWINGDRVV